MSRTVKTKTSARSPRPAAVSSYTGGVTTRLDTPWARSIRGGSVLTYDESFREQRERSRSLEQNNVLAAASLDRASENVIGDVIRVRPTSSSPEFNKQVADLWKRRTKGKFFDVRRMHGWGALQRLIYRAKLRDGDVGVILVDDSGQPALQVIEGHLIESPDASDLARHPETRFPKNIIEGIELSPQSAPVAFWVRSKGPNDQDVRERVDARDFVYLHRAPRYGFTRGEPVFNGAYTLYDQIVGYLDAVVVAARVGASQAMIVQNKSGRAPGGPLQPIVPNGIGLQKRATVVEPGMIQYVDSDGDVRPFNPSQPTQSFPDAITTFSRFLGLKFGLTIEQLLLDFSRTSYSSARAARNQSDFTALIEQVDFNDSFLSRVYPWAVSKWIKAGLITAEVPDDYFDYEWIPSGKPWVDPTKEIAAAREAIALGVDCRTNVATERGFTFTELCDQNEADINLMVSKGLPIDLSKNPTTVQPGEEQGPPPPAPTKKASKGRRRRSKHTASRFAPAR